MTILVYEAFFHASPVTHVVYITFQAGRLTRSAPTQAPVGAFFYALRASRSVVVSLSLSRRNAASESAKKAVARGGPPWPGRPLRADDLPPMVTSFFFIHVLIGGLQDRRQALDGFGYPMIAKGNVQVLGRDLSADLTAGLMEIPFFYMLPDDDEFIAADAKYLTAMAVLLENRRRMTDEPVAAGMAFFVVRLLKVIDVGKEDAHTDLAVNVLLISIEGIAVKHAGHLIDETVVPHLIDMVAAFEQHQKEAACQAE